MKTDKWIVEVDGHKFAIDRTLRAHPAIYYAKEIKLGRHFMEKPRPYRYKCWFDTPIDEDCVVIMARPLNNDGKED